jgi:hypothetical protein
MALGPRGKLDHLGLKGKTSRTILGDESSLQDDAQVLVSEARYHD